MRLRLLFPFPPSLLCLSRLVVADQPSLSLSFPVLLSCPSLSNATFLFGGQVAEDSLGVPDIWRYDTLTASWTSLPPTNLPAYRNTSYLGAPAATCVGTTIYGTLPDGTFASYDLLAHSWKPLAQQATPMEGTALFALANGTILSVGKFNPINGTGAGRVSSAVEVFNWSSNSWSSGPAYLGPVTQAAGVAIGDVAY
ncbi:hypothetical protein BDK51DRAFT_34291, partial [Blyttiomyces helicus]